MRFDFAWSIDGKKIVTASALRSRSRSKGLSITVEEASYEYLDTFC